MAPNLAVLKQLENLPASGRFFSFSLDESLEETDSKLEFLTDQTAS